MVDVALNVAFVAFAAAIALAAIRLALGPSVPDRILDRDAHVCLGGEVEDRLVSHCSEEVVERLADVAHV